MYLCTYHCQIFYLQSVISGFPSVKRILSMVQRKGLGWCTHKSATHLRILTAKKGCLYTTNQVYTINYNSKTVETRIISML